MKVLDFGKHSGKVLADCEASYIRWLARHERVLAERNRWASRDARFILERKKAVEITVEALAKATRDVIYGEGKAMSLFQVPGGWKFAIDGEQVAADVDQATCIKKGLHRSGYLQKVVAKLSA